MQLPEAPNDAADEEKSVVSSKPTINATTFPLLEIPEDAAPPRSEDDNPSSAQEY